MTTAHVAAAISLLFGIFLGYAMRQFEEQQPLKIHRTMKKLATEPADMVELQETEQFLAFLHDDTQDDIRLKRYRPVKVRNQPPLAIAAMPHVTTASMQRIRVYMLEHGPNAQRTKIINRD